MKEGLRPEIGEKVRGLINQMVRGFTCAGQTRNPSTAARDAPALGDVTFPADTAGARGPRYITSGRRWISRFCKNKGRAEKLTLVFIKRKTGAAPVEKYI